MLTKRQNLLETIRGGNPDRYVNMFAACDACGKHYFIPSASQGGVMSTYQGVYEALGRQIDAKSAIDFG